MKLVYINNTQASVTRCMQKRAIASKHYKTKKTDEEHEMQRR